MSCSIKFTGGSGLPEELRIFHEVNMQNELSGDRCAYELSDTKRNSSGPSFGGSQMDLGSSLRAARTLFKIAVNSVDFQGRKIISNDELDLLEPIIGLNLTDKDLQNNQGKSPEQVFGNLLPKLNQAMQSPYGITQINAAYQEELLEKVNEIRAALGKISNPIAKAFYSTPIGEIMLYDYHNQNGFNTEGSNHKFFEYLSSGITNTYTGKQLSFRDVYTIEHHKEFLFNTLYGLKHPADVNRRLVNIDDILKEFKLLPVSFESTDPSVTETKHLCSDTSDGSVIPKMVKSNIRYPHQCNYYTAIFMHIQSVEDSENPTHIKNGYFWTLADKRFRGFHENEFKKLLLDSNFMHKQIPRPPVGNAMTSSKFETLCRKNEKNAVSSYIHNKLDALDSLGKCAFDDDAEL